MSVLPTTGIRAGSGLIQYRARIKQETKFHFVGCKEIIKMQTTVSSSARGWKLDAKTSVPVSFSEKAGANGKLN